MRCKADAERLFKTERKDPGKRSSSEDDLADELQDVLRTQRSPTRSWDSLDGNELDGDRPLFNVGLPTPLS